MPEMTTLEQTVKFDFSVTQPQPMLNFIRDKSKRRDYDVERSPSVSPNRLRPGPIPSGNSSMTMVTGSLEEGNDKHDDPTVSPGGIAQYFKREINPARTEILLIICAFVSGVIDSAAFNAWGSFANMQTGNVVFLALGVSGQPPSPPNRWAKSLAAIGIFSLGVLFFSYASRFLTPLRRSTLVASFALQTSAVITASILVQTGVVDSKSEMAAGGFHWLQVLPISILAFQAAGQIVTSRLLGIDEIPTVVLTTLLCDLFMDRELFSFRPRWRLSEARTRRLLTLLAAFSGAMLSGGLSKLRGLSASLWLASGVKAVVTLCFLLWKGKQDNQQEEFEEK